MYNNIAALLRTSLSVDHSRSDMPLTNSISIRYSQYGGFYNPYILIKHSAYMHTNNYNQTTVNTNTHWPIPTVCTGGKIKNLINDLKVEDVPYQHILNRQQDRCSRISPSSNIKLHSKPCDQNSRIQKNALSPQQTIQWNLEQGQKTRFYLFV